MPRKLKATKAGEFVHSKAGIRLDLMLDRNDQTFFISFGEITVRAKTADETRRLMRDIVANSLETTWLPVIMVKELAPFAQKADAFVGFDLERYYYAKRPAGDNMLRLRWDDYQEGQSCYDRITLATYTHIRADDFTLPLTQNHGYRAQTYFLPYTEPCWQGLISLQQAIRQIKVQLWELIGTPEGQAILQDVGARLLAQLPAVAQG